MSATVQQVVNGHIYSWSSIEIEAAGMVFAGVKEINYADSVKPGRIYGSDGVQVGGTPGKSTPSLEIHLYRRDWDALRTQLAGADGTQGVFSTKFVNVRVAYAEQGIPGVSDSASPTVTDYIEKVRIVGPSSKNSVGSDPTVVVLACEPTIIRWGGSVGSQGHTALPEVFAGDPPAYGPPTEAHVNEFNSGLSTRTFWGSSGTDGFWGEDYATNTWDTVIIAGQKLPGICKVTATPSRMVEKQKPNGRDAAALILRGYQQPDIEIEMTIWTPSHNGIWSGIVAQLWQKPNKSSVFEEPKENPAPQVGASKTVVQAAAVEKANNANEIIKREQRAIQASKAATIENAVSIYHPALGPFGISNVIIESISTPVDGAEPQTKVVKIKCIEHIVAGLENATKKTRSSTNRVPQNGVTVDKPLQMSPSKTEGKPKR